MTTAELSAQPPARKTGFSNQRQTALSRWENEGGAVKKGARPEEPELTNTELVQLRIRVIALENLFISLLAEALPAQIELAREMAVNISPRAGASQHPLTLAAARQMNHLLDRAAHF